MVVAGKTAKKFNKAAKAKAAAPKAAAKPVAKSTWNKTTDKRVLPSHFSKISDLKYMDAFGKDYPPAFPTMGNFNTLSKISRFSIDSSTTTDRILCFLPSTSGKYQTFLWETGGGLAAASSLNWAPTFTLGTEPPVEMKTFRSSMRVRNVTKANDVGGSIQVLQLAVPLTLGWNDSGVTADLTSAYFDELKSMITQSSKSREYSAHQFCTGDNSMVLCPATLDGYQSWTKFDATGGYSALQTMVNLGQMSMSMQTMMLLIPQTPTVNTYNISLCSQLGVRFALGTVLSDLARPQSSKVKTDSQMQTIVSNVQEYSNHFHNMSEYHLPGPYGGSTHWSDPRLQRDYDSFV